MLRHGIPEDVVARPARRDARVPRLGRERARSARRWPTARGCRFAGRAWRVHHRPGTRRRTRSSTTRPRGELIAGDHLIKHISSNPLISRPLAAASRASARRRSSTYLASLRATRAMDLDGRAPRPRRSGRGPPGADRRALRHARAPRGQAARPRGRAPPHRARAGPGAVGQRRGDRRPTSRSARSSATSTCSSTRAASSRRRPTASCTSSRLTALRAGQPLTAGSGGRRRTRARGSRRASAAA